MTDVHKIFQEIEEKSKDGDYIYRGEPKCHENVSSRLWRKFAKYTKDFDVPLVDISKIQDELLCGARNHVRSPLDKDIDILSEIQHYGGDTNLIDFTTNYLVALFFACEQQFDEDGRVILQDRAEKEGFIEVPNSPQNSRDSKHRIVAQKSVFVQRPEGLFIPQKRNVVIVLADQKQDIMSYLEKYQDISMSTIYNDLHGYIKYQDRHGGGYTQFYAGLASMNKGNYETASEHFTRAINLNCPKAIYYRGSVYTELGQYDNSISDYNAAFEFMRDAPDLYVGRGLAYLFKGEFDMALEDFNSAIDLDNQLADVYMARGGIYHKVKDNRTQALSDYDESIRLKPDGNDAYYFRAILYYQMYEDTKNTEYWNKAFGDFKKAANVDPSITKDIPEEIKRAMDFTQSLSDSVAGRDITGRRITKT